jgi:hypothetical protein
LTTQADQKIGRDAIDRYKTLRAELDQRQKEARALLGEAGDGRRKTGDGGRATGPVPVARYSTLYPLTIDR